MEIFLKEILEYSPDIHYYYDIGDSVFKYINPAFEEHFGIQIQEVLEKNYHILTDIVHPDDRESFEYFWQQSLTSENLNAGTNNFDFKFRIQSGKFFCYRNTHRIIMNPEGKAYAMVGILRDITDLKIVEILKSTSKERLTLAMEAANDCYWEWKVQSNRLFLDANFYSILGYEAYEFPDTLAEWGNRMHPEDRTQALNLLKQCATGISPQIHIEYRIATKTGPYKWILCRARTVSRNEDGAIIKIIGTQTDITKLKEAEYEIKKQNSALKEAETTIQKNNEALQLLYNSLKENEERLKLFFDAADNNAFILLETIHEEHIITEFSNGGENIFEIKRKNVVNLSFQNFAELTGNNTLFSLITDLSKSEEQFRGEIPIFNSNKEEITCILTVYNIQDEKTCQPKILIIITDIRERKEFELALQQKNRELIAAEEELKSTNDELILVNNEIQRHNLDLNQINDKLVESEEKFRELAENTQDAFWLRDQEKFLYINPSFEKVLGIRREDLISNPEILEERVHPEDKKRFNKWSDFYIFNNIKSYSEQYRIIKSDGTIRWLWSRIHPVYNGENIIYRLAGIATDITEQKEMEEALVRAKEKALESDNLKSAFLANISHEIRTPMNGILGFIELLNDPDLDEYTRGQYIGIISRSSKQLLQIINDIIDISKLEANQVIIESREFMLNSTLHDIYMLYQKDKIVTEKKEITLKLDLAFRDEVSKVIMDESRLRQILMNILDNAVKFTFEGEIIFGYRLTDSKTLSFYVKDCGIGIAQDQYDNIFKNFRQIDGSHTRKFGGTGLGLSISYGMAKLMGGSIDFESQVGQGTTFYIHLPYHTPKKKTEYTTEISEYEVNFRDKVILVVEDDEINFDFLQAVLEPTEAMILHAGSGEDAIRIYSANKDIDIILMDIRLPGISGYEAMRAIKNQKPDIPIIAQTAFALAEDNVKCIEQGFDGYISKPINRKLLIRLILEQLQPA